MGSYLVIFALSQFRQAEYKNFLGKISLASFGQAILFAPFVLVLQSKNNLVSRAFSLFSNPKTLVMPVDSFLKFPLLAKIAYLFSPLILIFRRQPQILLLL